VAGPAVPSTAIDQDYLIATSTKLEIGNVNAAEAGAAVKAAAQKIPEMLDFLSTPFSLKPGDRPHLMKF
jgi:large subunit ribosomal protein L6e